LLCKWPQIQKLAQETLPSGDTIRQILRQCGAPATLNDIGVPDDCLDSLLQLAPFVRSRLTLMRAATILR
jgi:glycerol dehydrogenase-like iron-containing ADH family enzyme